MISLVMADQLRTVVLNSISAFSRLWDPFDLALDPHAASAGCPLENSDGSAQVCPHCPAHISPLPCLNSCEVCQNDICHAVTPQTTFS